MDKVATAKDKQLMRLGPFWGSANRNPLVKAARAHKKRIKAAKQDRETKETMNRILNFLDDLLIKRGE